MRGRQKMQPCKPGYALWQMESEEGCRSRVTSGCPRGSPKRPRYHHAHVLQQADCRTSVAYPISWVTTTVPLPSSARHPSRSVQARCPHLGIAMAGGKVQNGVITCSQHKSSWNCETGEVKEWLPGGGFNVVQRLVSPPCGLAVYDTKVEDGKIYVGQGASWAWHIPSGPPPPFPLASPNRTAIQE